MNPTIKEKRWFWAWLIEMTISKARLSDVNAECEVWKNLVILEAADEGEAVEKALARGRLEEGDVDGTLRLWGEPAVTKFLGVANIGVIHEKFEDGAELVWDLVKCKQREAASLVCDLDLLRKNLKRELNPQGPRKDSKVQPEAG
jgi:uncharacterized protein DUF4288